MLDRRLRVLDPLCGRGTTLNQALTYGYDAAGIDLDGKDFEAYAGVHQTYLKRKRIKHRAEADRSGGEKQRRRPPADGEPGAVPGVRPATLSLDVVHADTTRRREFFRPATSTCVVADAPYGVQHGSRTVAAGLRRDPLDLLAAAPGVGAAAAPGRALGISWNTHVARREDAAAVLRRRPA